jgi:predicted AAA+ superfamily ATPase
MYQRLLFSDGSPKTSCFILGPRQTGKTTLLETLNISVQYNLLQSSEFVRLSRDPDLIFKECSKLNQKLKHTIWIDEVQKIPKVLDVVHRTIEKFKNINFILSGSSARKLRAEGVNLLGGRALDFKLHPLTSIELKDEFSLETSLKFGTLPKISSLLHEGDSELAIDLLNSYVSTYLDEEIQKEALVRDLQPFQRFLEVAAQAAGGLINFSKIADDSQISHTAAVNYFSILQDTLIGFLLDPYHASVRKQLIKQPKFYFFDNGVNRAILNTLGSAPTGLEKGVMFEQFVIQEVRRVNDYFKKRLKLYFWRTEAGAEVDLLLCRGSKILLAVECKASPHVKKRDLSGLKAFKKDYPKVKTLVCAPVERDQEIEAGFTVVTLKSLITAVREA